MKPRYLHIGYPKCASTALQQCFFQCHPQLSHLGISQGPTFHNHGVRLILEHDIRTHREDAYDSLRAKRVFDHAFLECEADKKTRCVGLSHERIGFSMSDDIDPSIKAKRIHAIMGDNTKVLIVIRRQDRWLKSMFKQMIFMGMGYDWHEFLDWMWQSKHQSFYADLNFLKRISTYRDLFGRDNVMIVTQEMIKMQPKAFLITLQKFLNIDILITELPKRWESPDSRLIEATRRLNLRYPNGVGAIGFPPSLRERYSDLMDKKSGMHLEAYMEREVINAIGKVSEQQANRPSAPKLNFNPHPEVTNAARDEFIAWNEELAKEVRLPLGKLGYLDPNADWFV